MNEVSVQELEAIDGGGNAAQVAGQLAGYSMIFAGVSVLPGVNVATATFATALGVAAGVAKLVDIFSGGKL